MECEIRLGAPERGFVAAEEAATILRSAEIPETQRNQAIAAIGYLGVAFWMAGRVSEALALLDESARGLDERGLAERASHHRQTIATVLRKAGRLAEAEAALPDGTKLGVADHRRFLDERGEIHLAAGRSEEAVADFEAVVGLGTKHPPLGPIESAMAQASLAAAYLQANRLDEAEALTQTSSSVFRAKRHPDLAESLVTLAMIDWRRQDATSYWPGALAVMVDAPLVEPATKARFLERTAGRLERAGRIDEAAQARAAASAQWSALGAVQAG
jgi:hypothetical protein